MFTVTGSDGMIPSVARYVKLSEGVFEPSCVYVNEPLLFRWNADA